MDDETIGTDGPPREMDRRSLLRRGAVVGGALVWTTPVVQSIAAPAFAAVGSGAPAGACARGTLHRFQWRRTSTTPGLQDPFVGPCTVQSSAPITKSAQHVKSVTFETAPATATMPAGHPYSRARITLAPGYVLTRVQPRSADQSFANRNCAAVISNPTAVAGDCVKGRVYVVDSTSISDGKRTNLFGVSGEIRCDGCA